MQPADRSRPSLPRFALSIQVGVGAGALFGVSNVAIKFLAYPEGPIHGLLSP